MRRAGIVGLALWAPERARPNDAWPEAFHVGWNQRREERRERDFTHIEQTLAARPFDEVFVRHALPFDADPFKGATARRVADDDVPSAECDARALGAALEDACVAPEDVDLVLSAALVPDRLVPSNGPAVQHLAGCKNAAGIGLEAFCSSALAQLDVAAALVEAGRARFVACVQSHLIARINDLEEPVSPIFGDASTAFIVGQVPDDRGLLEMVRGGDGRLAGGVTHAFKLTPGAAWWRDARAPVTPGSDDPAAAREIAQNVLQYPVETILELTRRTGVPLDAVRVFATIQPMVWYQPALADALGVAPDRIPSTYPTYAHIGSCGVVANLLEARARNLLSDGAPVVLYAHGAGITRYAALLRWSSRRAGLPASRHTS